jgi:hypothetical protein
MGYTHSWKCIPEIDEARFSALVEDFRKVAAVLPSLNVVLTGPLGRDEPTLASDVVAFNGPRHCGHERRNLAIPWPAGDARGVGLAHIKGPVQKFRDEVMYVITGQTQLVAANDSDVAGTWFAGLLLKTRTCDGDCSHETFEFPRVTSYDSTTSCCKTAFKPYDLAATAFLVIAKHHLGADVRVFSDGTLEHWKDAMLLCQDVLGWGNDFQLDVHARPSPVAGSVPLR